MKQKCCLAACLEERLEVFACWLIPKFLNAFQLSCCWSIWVDSTQCISQCCIIIWSGQGYLWTSQRALQFQCESVYRTNKTHTIKLGFIKEWWATWNAIWRSFAFWRLGNMKTRVFWSNVTKTHWPLSKTLYLLGTHHPETPTCNEARWWEHHDVHVV